MTGLELSKKYFEELGRPAFEARCPELLERAAIGLVGEGSECFGFDDEISRDHDWGPGFCVWLTREDYVKFGTKAEAVYFSLPKEFMGYERLRPSVYSSGRVGILSIDSFYSRFLGIPRCPESIDEWRTMLDSGAAVATNGIVWQDPLGEFSKIRNGLLGFYPEDVRKKRIAKRAAIAAQAGQYNYYRVVKRGDLVAANHAVSEFIDNIQEVVFLLNLRYHPYYKWTHRAMKGLPTLGNELGKMIEALVSSPDKGREIERISSLVIDEFKEQGLSSCGSDFLLHHAEEIQASISDERIRAFHLMSD